MSVTGGRGFNAESAKAKHDRSMAKQREKWSLLPNESILGVRDATLFSVTSDGDTSALTQTTDFVNSGDWITQRADSARVLLTNSSGSSVVLKTCVIRGKPVTMLAGEEGRIHDEFQDIDDIERYGDKTFEFGNEDVIAQDQLNKLADYWWKYHKVAKHIYVMTLTGMWHFLQPGEWATLQVGGAGEAEYIDSTVEVFNVRMVRRPGELGETVVILREVEEAWKNDSNVIARFVASGPTSRMFNNKQHRIIASQYYPYSADSYCDGTADEVEINQAIDQVSANGGGIVQLTDGDYTLGAPIVLKDDVVLAGVGAGTVIDQNNNGDYAIKAIGSSGSELVNITVRDLKLTDPTAAQTKNPLFFQYVDNALITNVIIDDTDTVCLNATTCDDLIVSDCLLSNGVGGMTIGGARVRCVNNSMRNMIGGSIISSRGVFLSGASDGAVVANNNIEAISFTGNFANGGAYGVQCLNTTRVTIANNTIKTLSCTDSAALGSFGIRVTNSSDILINNNTIDSVDSANNSYGLSLDNSDDCSIEGCMVRGITETGSGNAWGVFVDDDCDRISIDDCQIRSSDHEGIEVEGDNCAIQDNIITSCDVGILIDATADRTVTTGNHSYNNTSAQLTDNGTNGVTANNLTV